VRKRRKFKLVHDLVALLGGQLLSKLVGFAAFVYLARTLDAGAYGAVEYAGGLAVVFGMAIEWGLGPIGVRALAADPRRLPSLAALIPTARFGLTLAAIPLMGLSVSWSGADAATTELTWLFALAMLALPWKQDWLLQGLEMMTAAALAPLLRMAAFAGAVMLLVDSSQDLVWVGAAEILSAVLFAAYFLLIQQFWIVPIELKFAFPELWRLLREGFSVGAANMIWVLLQYAPLILLANLVGGSETGWFAAAHRVVVSLLALSWIYHFNLYPTIARRLAQGMAVLRPLMSASFRVVAWGSVWSALLLMLLAAPLLSWAFGAAYLAAEPSFAVLAWVLPVTLLSGHARGALIAAGQQNCVLVAHIAGLVVLVIGGVPLIEILHGLGAATAMLAAALAVWAVSHRYATTRLGPLTPLSTVVLPVALALVMALLARLLAIDPLLAGPLAATAYPLCGLLLDRRLLADIHRLADAKSDPHP
jgi:O-antigen/teichoic acid export membrane protein